MVDDSGATLETREYRGLLALVTVRSLICLVRLDWNSVKAARIESPVGITATAVVLNLLAGALQYQGWSGLLRRRGITERGSSLEECSAINAGLFLGLLTPGTSGELTRGAFT